MLRFSGPLHVKTRAKIIVIKNLVIIIYTCVNTDIHTCTWIIHVTNNLTFNYYESNWEFLKKNISLKKGKIFCMYIGL